MNSNSTGNNPAPMLKRLRVLELATWVAAPTIGAILAEYGADVIHIEDPERPDPHRAVTTQTWGKSTTAGQVNSSWQMHNRNKRSLALSLNDEEGRAIFRPLLEKADIFITNLLPNSQQRLGIDYAALGATYPRLIHVGISGWGSAGPASQNRGYDFTVFWAASGIMSLVGDPDGEPALVRPGMGDRTAGLAATAALGLALYAREHTGKGQAIEVSLLHTGMFTVASDMQRAMMYGEPGPTYSRRNAPAPLTNCYRTRDGRWLVVLVADKDWPAFCTAIDTPQLAADTRFDTSDKRTASNTELIRILDEACAKIDRAELERRLIAARITHAPALLPQEAARHPQSVANHFFLDARHDTHGPYPLLSFPLRFSSENPQFRHQAPGHGEQTREILQELGYAEDDIRRLDEKGVIRAPKTHGGQL